jgi:hypothetical protein
MANDCIPFKRPGDDVTGKAEAAITGCRCVQISGDMTSNPVLGLPNTADGGLYTVGHPNVSGAAGAGKMIFGVAKYDALINGRVGVIRGGIVPIEAGAAIAPGAEVEVDATGRVITLASGVAIGTCLTTCTGAGVQAVVALHIE